MLEFNELKAPPYVVKILHAVLSSFFFSNRAPVRSTEAPKLWRSMKQSQCILIQAVKRCKALAVNISDCSLVMLNDILSIFKANTINVLTKESNSEYAREIRNLNEGGPFNKLLLFTFSENVIMELKNIERHMHCISRREREEKGERLKLRIHPVKVCIQIPLCRHASAWIHTYVCDYTCKHTHRHTRTSSPLGTCISQSKKYWNSSKMEWDEMTSSQQFCCLIS